MSEPFDQDETTTDSVVATLTAPRSKTRGATKTKKLPPYNVIVLNDEEHTFDYVIELLVKVFAHSLARAEELTWKIHNAGKAIVFTTHKEHAELKRDQVLSWGADPRMSVSKGPLDCYIELAESAED